MDKYIHFRGFLRYLLDERNKQKEVAELSRLC